MKNLSIIIVILLFVRSALFAQVAVNTDGTQPNGSAMLDVKSTIKGFLPPRMTLVQRNAIVNPTEGLMVFCTDCGYGNSAAASLYTNGKWQLLAAYCLIKAPVAGTHISSANQVIWNWNPAQYATGYKWNTTNNYASATDMGTAVTKTETGLVCNTLYTRYIWAYNICGDSSSVTVLTQSTLPVPVASPTAGAHVPSLNQIVWNWNMVTGCLLYTSDAADE